MKISLKINLNNEFRPEKIKLNKETRIDWVKEFLKLQKVFLKTNNESSVT